jgi:hypothetical protein
METQQMAMPAEMATQGPNPEEMAIYEQMRQQISPQEFSNEMLAGASQVDPQAVAEFTEELQSLDVSPEELDALNDLVDQILANPEQYDQLRQQFLAQGMPDDILPEQFDPYFFAALNMAVDQMIAAPTGVQAFAQGGIAELKPIAKAIASYGRNGDTMLAHITPAEARMLKRRGGSGTINPATGLPEFFLKKAFKKIGKAVKKFASSTVGRIVTTVALGFFLGPAAASFLGASSVAGVAAVSGFVGAAGSTLLAGGNLKDALKAGAIGGLTAGAGAGIMGGADAFASGSASTAGLTPGQAFQGQVDKFTGAFTPGAAAQAPVPQAGAPAAGIGPDQMPVPDAAPYSELKMTGTPVKPFPEFFGDQAPAAAGAPAPAGSAFDATASQGSLAKPLGGTQPGMFDSAKKFVSENISPSGIKEAATPAAQEAGSKAVSDLLARVPTATPAMQEAAYQTAFKSAMPGVLGTYGPAVGAGLGIMALSGGFDTKPVQGGPITQSLMKTADQRIREKGLQRQMYMQDLPGVVYDEFGAPVFGQSTRLPTYDVPDYNYGGFNMSGAGGQGGMNLPPVYVPPSGAMGSRQVAQPYNNANMYSNLMAPQRYADGGTVTDLYRTVLRRDPSATEIDNWKAQFGDSIDERERAVFREAAGAELAAQRTSSEQLATEQKAARDAVAQRKAMRRAAGSGSMYANINAGISALAPETNPMDTADTTFGARNRQAQLGNLQQTYGPMLEGQRLARVQQAQALGQAPGPMPSPFTSAPAAPQFVMPSVGVGPQAGVQNPIYHGGRSQEGGEGGPGSSIVMDPFYQPAVGQSLGNTAGLSMQQIANTPGMGNFDPFYQQRMALDAQVTARNSQGQNATPEQMAEMRRLSELSENDPGVNARRDALNKEAMERGIFYTQGAGTPGITPGQIANTPGMGMAGIGMNFPGLDGTRIPGEGPGLFGNTTGIASLAEGGYPRRNGQISGPGTEKSDSIPAMLSDGEFVLTAKAVRGADPTGKGSRRAGAKQMYKLMHQLEKNAERG